MSEGAISVGPMSELLWREAPARETGAAQVRAIFEERFGGAPDGVWSAPGRVNIIGDHTDYAGGIALPAALPHRTYVALRRRKDNEIHLYSTHTTPEDDADSPNALAIPMGGWVYDLEAFNQDEKPTGWGAYVAGVAWALFQLTDGPDWGKMGFDAVVDSYVPVGSSLSSSAALEAAVAVALDDVWKLGLGDSSAGRLTLAGACQMAENDVVGVPSGGLDQTAALLSAPGHAVMLDFSATPASAALVPFNLEDAGLTLLIIDSRAPRQLADGQYAARREAVDKAAEHLEVKHLREIPFHEMEEALERLSAHDNEGVIRRRARHVVTENARAAAFIDVVRHGLGSGGVVNRDAAALAGALLDASHHSLRDDHEVTVRETDLAAATARASGAYGARMTGGGFGGAVIALVNSRDVEPIAEAVAAGFDAVGLRAPAFLIASPSAPAGKDM